MVRLIRCLEGTPRLNAQRLRTGFGNADPSDNVVGMSPGVVPRVVLGWLRAVPLGLP